MGDAVRAVTRSRDRAARDTGVAFAAATAFGTLAFFAEVALRAGATTSVFLTGRFSLAVIVLGIIFATGRQQLGPRTAAAHAFIVGAVVYGVQSNALVSAVDLTSASIAAVLFATYPAFVIVLMVVTGRRAELHRAHFAALLCVLVGAALVIAPAETSGPEPLGAGLALLAAAAFACFIVTTDHLARELDHVGLAFAICLGALLSVVIAGAARGDLNIGSIDAEGWWAILGAGALATAFAFVATFAALPRIGPATTGIVLGAEPLITVLLGVAVLGEDLTISQVIGGTLIVAAVITLGRTSSTKLSTAT